MKPTPEQLEAIARVLNDEMISDARAAWDLIAPMVLEEAAKVADDYPEGSWEDEAKGAEDAAARIRAMKGEP